MFQNDTSRVNVTVEDVNEWEPRFRHPRYEFHAATLKEGSVVGKHLSSKQLSPAYSSANPLTRASLESRNTV